MRKQYFSKEQTDPLLGPVNITASDSGDGTTATGGGSSGDGGALLSVDGVTSRQQGEGPLTHELKRTWRHLKISMTLLFLSTLGALGVLIYGCILISIASSNSRADFDSLVSAISTFQQGGYVELQKSDFWISTSNVTSYQMANVKDPYQDMVDKSSDDTAYNSSVIVKSGIPVVLPITTPTTNNNIGSYNTSGYNNDSLVYFAIAIGQVTNGSEYIGGFVVAVPYYTISVTTCSLHQGERECNDQGGYFDPSTLQCSRLFLLDSICVQITPDPTSDIGWDSTNLGCVYPFDNPGIYVQHAYTNVTDIYKNGTTTYDFMIRSSDDPYIALQSLTSGGMSLNDVFEDSRSKGIYFMVIAFIILGITFSLGTALFFVKRKIKRGYKKASRIPIQHYSRPPIYRYLALSLASFGIAMGIGFPLLGHWSEESTWTYTPFFGLLLIVWIGPVGMVSMLIFWQMVVKYRQWSARLRLGVTGLVGAAIAVLCALSIKILMKPWRFDYGVKSSQPDYLQVFFGILIVLTFFPFAILMLSLCINYFVKENSDKKKNPNDGDEYDDAVAMQKSDIRTTLLVSGGKSTTRRLVPSKYFALFGLFVLFVVFAATVYLPPIWNVPCVDNYNIFISPYSLVHFGDHSKVAIAKLYLDVVVYYGYIAALVGCVMIGGILNSWRRKKVVHRVWIRIPLPHIPFLGKVTVDTSVAEIAFLSSIVALAAWWFWWWFSGYGRIAHIVDTLERLARVMGHMTNLFASLLLFPVTRNSIWVELLGIPFERAIQYHRWAGVVVFISLTGHMLVWWINWGVNGTLIHNIFSVQNIPHLDNWSIPLMQLTWLGAAVMILLSQNWFRRRRFELFYYTHHFFIIFFITGLIHAWSMWYFTGGGMILWFIDRLIRFYKSSKSFPVVSIHSHNNGDITQITLQANNFAYRAGQYAFINIPSITPLEWHPFTISSSPGDANVTFHIKNMGKNTWTARLARVYGRDASFDSLPVVNIDGPYGNPPPFMDEQHDTLLLVAGGIGITPIISIFKDQYQLHRQSHPNSKMLKHVYLLWVVRDMSSLEMFREVFDDISNDPHCQSKFHIILRVTQRSFSKAYSLTAETTPLNPQPIMGRPNLLQEFGDIAQTCGKNVLAMVCGPNVMIKEVQSAAYKFKFDLHVETFEL